MAQTAAPSGDNLKTIKELGPVLPLGVESGGEYHKGFSVKPWRMKEERELGALRDNNKDATVFQYVGMVLSAMLQQLGPYDFTKEGVKFEQKRVWVGQLTMGDVFYAYVWLRIQTLGADLGLNVRCPGCSRSIENFTADLNSVEVTTAENMDQACWEYHLHVPFQARGKLVKTLVIGPPRWNALEMLQGPGGYGTAKPAVIRASIMGLGTKEEADPLVITDSELDDMSKRDIEALVKQINDKTVGPNMAVEGQCPHCKVDFRQPIDWGYDNFFGDSSQ